MALAFFKKSHSAFVLFQDNSDKLIKEINKDLKKCSAELKKKRIDGLQANSLKEICSKNLEKIAAAKEALSELKEENEPKPIPKFSTKKEEKLKKLNDLENDLRDFYSKLDAEKQAGDPKDADDVKDGKNEFHGHQSESNRDDEAEKEDLSQESNDGEEDDDGNNESDEDNEEEASAEEPIIENTNEEKNNKTSNNVVSNAKKKSVTLITDKADDDDDDNNDDDDSNVGEDGDQGEEDNETINLPDGENLFVALKGFPGQQEGDLAFEKNEMLKVLKIRTDKWMVAINAKGEQGLVPGNFFEKCADIKDPKGVSDINEVENENEDHDEYEEEEEDDDDDNDNNDDNDDTQKKVPTGDPEVKGKESKARSLKKAAKKGRFELWTQLKSSIGLSDEKKTELIKSLTTVPSGYREPTLSKLSSKTKFSLKYHMHPNFSRSCLNFKDLAMDVQTNQVELRHCRIQYIVDLVSIKNLPLPSDASAVKILDKHVRICLFDGQNFLSNVLVLHVNKSNEEYNFWKFSNQANTPSSEFSQIFIRSDSSPELGVLFELTAILQTSVETIELSCGWSFLNFMGESGILNPNRTYQLPINGGTPFEKGVPIDKNLDHPRNLKFSFASLMKSIKDLPILTIRLSSPKKTQNLYLESLPDVMIGQTSNLPFLFLYRQYLIDALIKYRNDPQSTEVLHSPLLSSLTEILDQPDIMDALRISWNEKLKSLSRSEKRNTESLKATFLTVFMENVYPLTFLTRLKHADYWDLKAWKIRKDEIQNFIKDTTGRFLSGLELFTKANVPLLPFDTKELTFNLLDSNSANLSGTM